MSFPVPSEPPALTLESLLGLHHVGYVHGARNDIIMQIDEGWYRFQVRRSETREQSDLRSKCERHESNQFVQVVDVDGNVTTRRPTQEERDEDRRQREANRWGHSWGYSRFFTYTLPVAERLAVEAVEMTEAELNAIIDGTSYQSFEMINEWIDFVRVPDELHATVAAHVAPRARWSAIDMDRATVHMDLYIYAVSETSGRVFFDGGNYRISCDWLDLPFVAEQGIVNWRRRGELPEWLRGKADE